MIHTSLQKKNILLYFSTNILLPQESLVAKCFQGTKKIKTTTAS